ncbi:T9SS type A sorting domain-containing protein [Flavobacterium sp. N1994]|uniref:T9SS type A sorting domain-containing protein n=1 Tax=Flavobacterium sp. N1994 TaxID=2986827 RepID=UPI002222CAE5|nr:T9SS type A sorting domain-containing protein [Flavobacterium sp. N1994]
MKKITLLLFLMLFSKGFSQNLPLDFESTTIPYPFTDFDGGVATRIANPQISGINTSATVMQMVKGQGAVWAGSKITMAAPINFSTERLFKVKVFCPVAGKRLLLKFEGAGFSFEKLSAPITTANVWEELTFDFSLDAVNNVNNQIVFIFDLGTQGDGGPNSTYLFDDVTQSLATGPILDLPVLPLTFESTTVAYPFTDFAGGATTILPNPFPDAVNPSATVVRMIKNQGETYSGSVIQMAGPIDFSTNKIVKVKVWSPIAGKKLMLKFEGSPVDFDNGAFETEVATTVANAWEELTFDYTSPTLFPPVNNNDNKIVFFFDFGNQGDGSANSTYYFDDIAFSDGLSAPNYFISNFTMYPNPTSNQLTLEAIGSIEKITIYTILGQEVLTKNTNINNSTIDTSRLQKGVYIAKATIDGKESMMKFIKE